MKEIKISYLNARHQTVVEECIGIIKEEMYFATEDVDSGKYQDFLEVLNSVYLYSNNFYDTMLKDDGSAVYDEFIFLIPNMIFYTTIGFLTALKNSDNKDDIKTCLEKIAFSCENVTSELADILMDAKEKRKLECIKEDKHNEKVKLEDKGLW
tara:strand:- start:532 stop:990 length:459 start_codon:yes stop_codon:yes gene_type:complete